MDDKSVEPDDKVIGMIRGKFSIEDVINAAGKPQPEIHTVPETAEPEPPGEFEFLPTPGDPYKAHARPNNKPEITLHLLHKDGTAQGFSYGSFDSIDLLFASEPGSGPVIIMRFAGIIAREVLITGRNLNPLHVWLGQHRIAWLREQPPKQGFADGNAAVITGLTVRPVEALF